MNNNYYNFISMIPKATFSKLFLHFGLGISIIFAFILCSCNNSIDSKNIKIPKNPVVFWHASPDSNRIDLGFPILEVETYSLLRPEEMNDGIGTYSHHSHITFWNSMLVATWSNAPRDEDSPGQKVLMRLSADKGKSWTPFEEAFPALPFTVLKNHDTINSKRSDGVCLNANGYARIDDRLFLIAECLYLPGQKGLGRLARELRKNGSLGPIFWLYEDPVIINLDGEAFYTLIKDEIYRSLAGKINDYLKKPETFPSWDFLNYETRPIAEDGHIMCEPTYGWQLSDKTWMRIYRDLSRSGYNYSSFSKDDGESWSEPVRSNFPDAPSRSNAGTLPDGTVYIISNIRNNGHADGPLYPRDPLALSLSVDGLNFNKVFIIRSGAQPALFEGRYKDTGFEYPSSVVVGKELYVMYSVNKEEIQVSKISTKVLRSLNY